MRLRELNLRVASFGDLERIEMEGGRILGAVDFWSQGWGGIDMYDVDVAAQIMNVPLSTEERELADSTFDAMVDIALDRSP